jgi:ubiquinone/menaquinone biosynthesis C-methylase UbiE
VATAPTWVCSRTKRFVIGADLSLEMLRAAVVAKVALADADVLALPFESTAFDVALAAHMLYHVPDVTGRDRRAVMPGGAVMWPPMVPTTRSRS